MTNFRSKTIGLQLIDGVWQLPPQPEVERVNLTWNDITFSTVYTDVDGNEVNCGWDPGIKGADFTVVFFDVAAPYTPKKEAVPLKYVGQTTLRQDGASYADRPVLGITEGSDSPTEPQSGRRS